MTQPERQELWCHDCNRYVQFTVDLALEGNHVFSCPNCGHEHCRVVKDGKITDIRWDQRNGDTYAISTYSITSSATSTYHGGSTFLYQAWSNST